MSSSTVILPLSRRRHFIDRNGELSYSKRYDEKLEVRLDFTDRLKSGESVSSMAYEDSGVTRSNTALASNVASFDATGLGYTIATATLSSGRILELAVNFYDSSGTQLGDYGR